ncbi:MAG: hypothetical protein ACUVQZ_02845 [Candidatus Caldatribacteriaceae bacterium]
MPELYHYELSKAALILTQELFKLKEGETFLITADTESDERVVDATAGAAFALGAKPVVVWIPAPLGVGKAADQMLPMETITALLASVDAWVEFNNQWLLYSTPYDLALKKKSPSAASLPCGHECGHDDPLYWPSELSGPAGISGKIGGND